MRILGFQKRFKDVLMSGAKTSTIRDHKNPLKVGEMVQVWCPSPRSGKGKKIFEAEVLYREPMILSKFSVYSVFIDHERWWSPRVEELAKEEGFTTGLEMKEFFEKEHDLTGGKLFSRYCFRKCE